jgi:eukaryotic-like serine/threonine-protein kinase
VPLHEEATKLMKALRGLDDPDTLLNMNNLAAAYWQNHQLDRSIPLFEEVYRLTTSKRGENDPNALLALANLGVNYKSAGRLPEALDCLEKALSRIRQLPPLSQAPFAFVPRQLVDGYEKSDLFAKAETLRREALAALKAKDGPESVAYATELFRLGSNLLAQKKLGDAEPLVRECLSVLQSQQPDAWTTFLMQSNLGEILLSRQKYAEAEPLLLQGYQGLKKREAQIPNESKIRLTEALERLVHLYDAWGKPAEADKWRKQLSLGLPQ